LDIQNSITITGIANDAPIFSGGGWNEPSRTNPNTPWTWMLAHETKWSSKL